ncbi:MAG TPA: hypothetical protein PLI09_17285 [Candidatus Hydrogenedentes bacterium]|nr:hypothetical protein [Candidatus Hydrogenedentota bacterium]
MNLMDIHRIRIGAPPLACLRPLVMGLADSPAVEFIKSPVQELKDQFAQGVMDAALLPPFVALEQPGCRVIPGICLAAEQETGCARINSSVPLDRLSSLRADSGAEHLREWAIVLDLPLASDQESCDAVLVHDAPPCSAETHPYHYDLGVMWRERTDLPMVLFIWVCRSRAPYPQLRRILAQAQQEGMAEEAGAASYFHYRMASQEADSLRRLATLSIQHGLCPPDASIIYC